MRIQRSFGLFFLLAGLLGTGCDSSAPVVETRWRFVGGATLARQTNAPALREILLLPESAALRATLVTNVTRRFWQLAAGTTNAPAEALAAAQPLVADLLDQLSIGESLRPAPGRREFALALPADAQRAERWQAAWPKFFAAAQAVRGGAPGKPQVTVQSGWIVAVSDAGLTPPAEVLKTLAKIPAEPQAVLHAEGTVADGPAFALVAKVREGNVHSQLRLKLTQPLPARLPAWDRPSIIHDPIVKFTAVRGVSTWLSALPWLKELALGDVPDQFFVWANPVSKNFPAMQTFLAAPVPQPEAWVDRVAARLQPLFSPVSGPAALAGTLMLETNRHSLNIGNLPTPPRLLPLHEKDHSYLVLGLMPQARNTNALPREMLARLDAPEVLLYDWEITAETARHWNVVGQTADMLHRRVPMNLRPGSVWLAAAAEKMGEAVTEATVSGPAELSVKRKSAAGFTAPELVLFSRWLDGEAPARPRSRKPAAP